MIKKIGAIVISGYCMVKVKNKHRLKRKEIKELLERIHQDIDSDFVFPNDNIEKGTLEQCDLIFIDGAPLFLEKDNDVFFTLVGLLQSKPRNRYVVVDMGAVRFVINGADVMAPGIVDADESIQKNDMVWVCDEQHRKPLAVGRALLPGKEMKIATQGKAVTVLHYIGDPLWEQTKAALQ